MTSRRLVLAKETLTELRHDELANVGGGAQAVPTTPVAACVDSGLAACDSILRPCISNGCTL